MVSALFCVNQECLSRCVFQPCVFRHQALSLLPFGMGNVGASSRKDKGGTEQQKKLLWPEPYTLLNICFHLC